MKNLIEIFTMSKANLFSVLSTVLGIMLLVHFKMPFGFLFMVLVALFTIAMDFVYKYYK